MGAQTTNRKLPYPDLSDIPDVPKDIKALADVLDTQLEGLDDTVKISQQDIRVGMKYLGSGRDFKSVGGDTSSHSKFIGPDANMGELVYTAPTTNPGKLLVWMACSVSPRNAAGLSRPLYPGFGATDNSSTIAWARMDFAGTSLDHDLAAFPFSYTPMNAGQQKTFRPIVRFLGGQDKAFYTLMDTRVMFVWLGNAYKTDVSPAVASNERGMLDDIASVPFNEATAA